jgi:hypothetical protein
MSVDADICSLPPRDPSAAPESCVQGGLVDIAGTWTLTGLAMSDPYGLNMWRTSEVTYDVRIRREGSGWCVFGLAAAPAEPELDRHWYVDDNFARLDQIALGSHVPERHDFICRSLSDGAVHYNATSDGFQMLGQYHYRLEAVLTR